VRTEMVYPSDTHANRVIASNRIVAMMKEKHVRTVDITRSLPTALTACFTPTKEEIEARLEQASIQAWEMRMSMIVPIYQFEAIRGWRWLKNLCEALLPVRLVRWLFTRKIRTDVQSLD